jgi:hypothetical protein
MAVDDYLEPEVAVAVAVTAAVVSPPVRRVLRRGLVYGLAGLLIARDKIAGAAHEVTQKARQVVAAPANGTPAGESPANPASQAAPS